MSPEKKLIKYGKLQGYSHTKLENLIFRFAWKFSHFLENIEPQHRFAFFPQFELSEKQEILEETEERSRFGDIKGKGWQKFYCFHLFQEKFWGREQEKYKEM